MARPVPGSAALRAVARRARRRLRSAPDKLLVLGEGADAASVLRLADVRRAGSRWRVIRTGQLVYRRHTENHAVVLVGARSLVELRTVLPLLARCGRASRVVVVVTATDRSEQFVVPSTLTANRLERGEVRLVSRGLGGVVVTIDLRTPTAVLSVVRSVVSGVRPAGGALPALGLRVGVSTTDALQWTAGDPWARWVDASTLDVAPDDISPIDVVVGRGLGAGRGAAGHPPLLRGDLAARDVGASNGWESAARASWDDLADAADHLDGNRLLPPVDTRSISPRGFDNTATEAPGRLVAWPSEGRSVSAVLTSRGDAVAVLDPAASIGEDDVRRVRGMRHVTVDPTATNGPVPLARLLSQLLVAGVPVLTGTLPRGVRSLLGDDLSDRLEEFDEATSTDALAREAWSVGARRSALLTFGAASRWRRTATSIGVTVSPAPTVSVCLATKRAANLRFALAQLERQTWPSLEVVVALHGVSRDHPEVLAAVAGFTRPLHVLSVGADVVFGDVLNAALDASSGRLVAKMDDDDWYGPDHVTDLVLTHGYSGATLVGCADHFTYLEASDTTIRDHVHASECWASRVSGGTLIVARDDLVALGRWRPVRRAVDRCLIQAVGAVGGHIYGMHDLGFCLYRGSGDHTWAQGDESFLAREPESWSGLVLPPHVGEPVPR